jgi:NADH-ubiquinone oxidoreductase chain 6
MNSIYKVLETYTTGYIGEFLDILTLISIIFGIFIIISKNPIVSVLFLIFLFSSVSIYLIMLGINFVGISYLLVYVGAVSILFLFILMLINIRISELLSATSNSVPLAIIITISFYYPLSKIISYNTAKTINYVDVKPKELGDYFTIITQTFKNNIEISYATSKN